MKKYYCDHKGCDHAPFTTPQGLSMHVGRVHTKTIVAKGQTRPERAVVRFNGGNGTAVALEEQPVKVDRRTRAWREAHPEETRKPRTVWDGMTPEQRSAEMKRRRAVSLRGKKHTAQEVTINFCPQCGCHIHAVAMGMAVATHMKG